ncbi:hypothetical protein BDV93DRAFT_518942, partial [Ceratobasidium sp. AG-I]
MLRRSPVPSTTEPSIYSPQPVYHPSARSPSLHSQTLTDYPSPDKSPVSLGPPLTRTNSLATTDFCLPTPLDHVPRAVALAPSGTTISGYYGTRSSYGGPSGGFLSTQNQEDKPTKPRGGRSIVRQDDGGATAQPEITSRRYDVPLGQRLNTSPPITAPHMQLQRRRSARELISQYEHFESTAQSPPLEPRPRSVSSVSLPARRDAQLPPILDSSNPPRAPPSHCLPESPSYFSTFARSRGKMRESFTNLIQLLGDKAKEGLKKSPGKGGGLSISTSRSFGALPKGFKLKLGKRMSTDGGSRPESPGKDKNRDGASIEPDMAALLKTEPICSSLLLYQSPIRQPLSTFASSSFSTTPQWMPYQVSLYPTSIILEVPNPRLSTSSLSRFQIPIKDLFSVHSVLSHGDGDRPDGIGEDERVYVFEAECYGGRVERFAVEDMSVRRKWVNEVLELLSQANAEGGKTPMVDGNARPNSVASLAPSTLHPKSPQRQQTPTQILGGNPGRFSSRAASVFPNPWDAAHTSRPDLPPLDLSAPFTRSIPPSPLVYPTNTSRTPAGPRTRTPLDLSPSRTPAYPSRTPPRTQTPTYLNTSQTPTPRTPSRTSAIQQRASLLLSPSASARSGMTPSPSICRLDERSLVRSRRAVIERMGSPATSVGGSVRSKNGSGSGSVNWEALSEVRSGRGASSLVGLTSRRVFGTSSSGFTSELGSSERVSSPVEPDGSFFRPRWPFAEPVSSDSNVVSQPAGGLSLLARLASRPRDVPARVDPPPVQILGNIPPARHTTRPISRNAGTGPEPPGIVAERLASLTSALRESDVAHSTKASGLGQLVASTQDHILQALEESTRVSTQEHAVTTGHLERLHDAVRELGQQPGADAQLAERAEVMSMKGALERVERAVGGNAGEEGQRGVSLAETLEGVKLAVDGLASKMEDSSVHGEILAKIEAIGSALPGGAAPTLDPALLEELKAHISSLQPSTSQADAPQLDTSDLISKLDEIAAAVATRTHQVDLSEMQKMLEEIRARAQAPADFSDVLMKLDGVSAMCQAFMEAKSGEAGGDENTEDLKQEANEKLMQLLAALREDAEHRTTQAEQTAELIRYSNELNVWLEKFVMNASTQMDSVRMGIGVLRRDLGLDPPLPVEDPSAAPPRPGALEGLRGMLTEQTKAVGDVTATLNALLATVSEEQARNAETRQHLATDSVLKTIEVQRQEQERLLRQLSTDLSSEIRGERIRFVEAMSQATSMNIQLHVDEFKKQLTREVLALTDEVGRLRDERKTIQHQIAQLFMIKSEHEEE